MSNGGTNPPGGDSPSRLSLLTDVLKYPITVFSVLIALLIAKSQLGLTFGPITELTRDGIKFAQESSAKISDLESQLNAMAVQVTALTSETAPPAARALAAEVSEAAQTVSDQTTRLAQSVRSSESSGSAHGFIWIGNYGTRWDRVQLGAPESGEPIATTPDALQPGAEFTVLGNMVLRDGLPSNDDAYFRGRASVGVVPRGSRVRLLAAPVRFERAQVVQYWAEVETTAVSR